MIAYKGFNKDLACTRGRGTFQYEVGKTYREDKAQTARTGFHCVEEPIEVLEWYSGDGARYCMVSAKGDISEDGKERIACTEMTILKELTLQQLGILECEWIKEHPNRKCSKRVERDSGTAEDNGIVVVRGKNPKARGKKGCVIFLLKEDMNGNICDAGAYEIDGIHHKPDVYYRVDGRKAR
jgi:hypothetical protein